MSSHDPKTWMWAEAIEMLERADRLHRQFFQLGRTQAHQPSWEPPVDILERQGELAIQVALPGVSPERLEVLVDGATLVVRGTRPLPAAPGTIIHRLEIPYGRFERRMTLPSGSYELRQRELSDGCLYLTLRRLA